MIKKYLTGTLLLGFCALAAAFATSCARQGGPLSPDLSLLGTGNASNTNLLQVTSAILPTAVSQTAQVVFNKPVDPNTVIKNTTIRIYTQDSTGATPGSSETLYNNYALSFSSDKKILFVTPSNGGWSDNQQYHAVLTTGVRSAAGAQLDGNLNNIPESSEFDNVHAVATLGIPTAPGYNPAYNAIRAINRTYATNSGTSGFNFGSSYDVNNYYSYVTLTVRFAMSNGNSTDFQMDPGTFFVSATALHSNVSLIDQNGTPVSPVNVTVTSTGHPDSMDTLEIAFNPAPNTKYKFKLHGGLSGIRSSNASTLRLLRGFYFSGGGRSYAYAQDDTEYTTFQTVRSDGSAVPYVQVTGVDYTGPAVNIRFLKVNFNVPGGDGTLAPATINANNFRFYSSATGRYYIPSNVVLDNTTAPNPVVTLYLPLTFDPQRADDNGAGYINLQVVVLNTVKAADGTYLNNGDGVTGENDDTYLSPGTYSFYNYYSGDITTGGGGPI